MTTARTKFHCSAWRVWVSLSAVPDSRARYSPPSRPSRSIGSRICSSIAVIAACSGIVSGGDTAIVIERSRSTWAMSAGPSTSSISATEARVTSSPEGVASGSCSTRWVRCWSSPSAITLRSISLPSCW